MNKHGLVIVFIFICFVFSCHRKRFICAAYNTYFIHDQKERDQFFSPFYSDSLSEQDGMEGTTATDSKADLKSSNDFADSFWSKKGNKKYQPKEKQPRKLQQNGLLVAQSVKSKNKSFNDIEMKVISIKQAAKYSNADSSLIDSENPKVPHDSI